MKLLLQFKNSFLILFLIISLICLLLDISFANVIFFSIYPLYFIIIGFLIIWSFFIFVEVIKKRRWWYIIPLNISLFFLICYLMLVFFGQQLATKIPSFANLLATIIWPLCTVIPLISFEYTEYQQNKIKNNASK